MKEVTTKDWKKTAYAFLIGQNISLFGSTVSGFAMTWYITLKTNSGFWMMLATVAAFLPQVIMSLWGGVFADRYNRKKLIIIADSSIAIITLATAIIFWLGSGNLILLLIVMAIRSLAGGIQAPAVIALFPQLVPKKELTRMNGLNQTLSSVSTLLSPALGGVILGSFNLGFAFMIDVVTAIVGVGILVRISVDNIANQLSHEPIITEMKNGIQFMFSRTILRGIVITYAFAFFFLTPAAFLTPIYITRVFGDNVFYLTLNEIFWTSGSLLGGLFVAYKKEFKNKIKVIFQCLVILGITFGLLGVPQSFVGFIIIMGISGFFLPIMITAETVLIQETVPPKMMGRVSSIIMIITNGIMPLAMLLFGPLADYISIPLILAVSGGVIIIVGICFYLALRKTPILPFDEELN